MSLISLILILCVVGVLVWFINNKVPWIDGTWKQIINVVAFVVVALWLLQVFGLLGSVGAIRVGQ